MTVYINGKYDLKANTKLRLNEWFNQFNDWFIHMSRIK